MTQEMQVQSLFETNESAQSALKSNNTSKSVLDLGASSTKNGKFFGKNDERILSHDLCQNSQSISNSSLKTNNNFQNTTNSNQNLNNTTQNALNASDETNVNFENALNTDTKKPNNAIYTEKSGLDLSKNSQIPLKSNSHSSDKAKNVLTSAHISHNTINTNDNKDFAPNLNENNALISNDEFNYNIDFSDELKIRKDRNANFKPLVQYNKDKFQFLVFTDFTTLDFNLFMCLCCIANQKGNLKIKVSFKDLEFLMGKNEKNKKRLCEKYNNFAEKASKIIIKIVENKGINTYTGLFNFIKVYDNEKIIIIQFNALMVSALNNFVSNYTCFELGRYCALSSKYSKQFYILLANNLYTQKSLKIEKNELIRYLNLNAKFYNKYNQKLSENILDVIKRDINEQQLFNRELQYKRIIGKNNKTLGYEFIYG